MGETRQFAPPDAQEPLGATPEDTTEAMRFRDVQTPEMAARWDEWSGFTGIVDDSVEKIDTHAVKLSNIDVHLVREEQKTLRALEHAGYGPEMFFGAPYDHLAGPAGNGEKSTADKVKAGETTFFDEAQKYVDRGVNVSATVAGTMLREAYLNGEFQEFGHDNPFPFEIYPVLAAAAKAEAKTVLGDAKSSDELHSNDKAKYEAMLNIAGTLEQATKPDIHKGYSVTTAEKIRSQVWELAGRREK